MSINIENRQIERVLIIDDDPQSRQAFVYPFEELGLETKLIEKPPDSVDEFVDGFTSPADVILCDYHLKKYSYSSFDGDRLVAKCFQNNIPGILCSSFTDLDTTLNRHYLRYIPSLLRTIDLPPDLIIEAYTRCIKELNGEYSSERKSWKTLIRIDEIVNDGKYFYVVIPGWNPDKRIRIYFDNIPRDMEKKVNEGLRRLYAQVNLGAENYQDLYFSNWHIIE